MVASSIYDEAEVRHPMLRQSASLIGPSTAQLVGQILEKAGITATRTWARLVAFAERSAQWFTAVGAVLIPALNIGVSVGLITLIFALLFRTLPDDEIRWRAVLGGAFLTAMLFPVGKYLISFHINCTHVSHAYGAAGAVGVVLVWIYYSTVIMLFGARYTHVRTRALRGKVEPGPRTAPDRSAQKGIG